MVATFVIICVVFVVVLLLIIEQHLVVTIRVITHRTLLLQNARHEVLHRDGLLVDEHLLCSVVRRLP